MKVALLGATGFIGSEIFKELVSRGHEVIAITRNPERVPKVGMVRAARADAANGGELENAVLGAEALITSLHFSQSRLNNLLAAAKKTKAQRLLMVGGAGSLEVAPGVRLIDTPEFPAEWKEEATKGAEFLAALRKETQVNWTFLSPAALIQPGERTGKFRLGGDQFLSNEKGESKISTADFAVAMVDELEHPKHSRRRFSVLY
jgi:putative NADH-flavin reductase